MTPVLRAAACAAMLLVACGGEPADDTLEAPAPEAPSGTAPPVAAPAAAPADLTAVAATLDEWNLVLSRDTVQAGLVSIRVRNAGSVTHRFEIEGNGEEVVTDDLQPGDEVTMSLNLTRGTYRVYCPIEEGGRSHAELGMRAALHVR